MCGSGADDEEREANHGARYPGAGVSSCFRRGPEDHCKEECNREYDPGGLQVVGRVLPVRDDAVRERELAVGDRGGRVDRG